MGEAFVYFKHEDEGKGPEFARRWRLLGRGLRRRLTAPASAPRRTIHNASQEIDRGPLGPIAVEVGAGHENNAVPPSRVTISTDVGLPVTSGRRERLGRHERIVVRGDDQRRHADAIDDAQRAGAVVVVAGVAEAVMRRGVGLVEPRTVQIAAQRQGVVAKRRRLAAHAAFRFRMKFHW